MLLVLGDSHVRALRDGFSRLSSDEQRAIGKAYGGVEFQQIGTARDLCRPFFEVRHEKIQLLGRVERAFGAVSPEPHFYHGDKRYFLFSAGFHNATMIAEIADEFTIDPAVSDKYFLSEAAFQRLVKNANTHLMIFFEELKKLDVRFAVFGSPPVPIEQVAKYGMRPGAAPQLPLMIDRAKAITAAQLSSAKIRYVLPPPDVAEGGYLRHELVSQARPADHHGNAAYGEIMLRHVFESLRPEDFEHRRAGEIRRNAAQMLR